MHEPIKLILHHVSQRENILPRVTVVLKIKPRAETLEGQLTKVT